MMERLKVMCYWLGMNCGFGDLLINEDPVQEQKEELKADYQEIVNQQVH